MKTELYRNSDHIVSEENDHCTPNSGRPLLCIEYTAASKVHAGETHFFRDGDSIDGLMTGAEAKAMYAELGKDQQPANVTSQ